MIYTGIGARSTPPEIVEKMIRIGRWMANQGWILRSGGAPGADKAFEKGCDLVAGRKEIYLPKDARPWCYKEASKHMDKGFHLNRMKAFTQALIARNMMQVLGSDGLEPSELVICWTPNGDEVGGTRYAMRCARAHNILVYNLALDLDTAALRTKFV